MAVDTLEVGKHVAKSLGLPVDQVQRTLALLDDGNTVPFIARYRKEATGGLDEVQIRDIAATTEKYRALIARKADVIRLIGEQDKLTPELEAAINQAETLQAVDDLYRPYRPRRRTRADIARARGLEPLAQALLVPTTTWQQAQHLAAAAVTACTELPDTDVALAGTADIIAEQIADDATTRAQVRTLTYESGVIASSSALTAEKSAERTVYEAYYDFSRPIKLIKPYAVLAIDRGEREEVLKVSLQAPVEAILAAIENGWVRNHDLQVRTFLTATVADAYKRLLAPAIERELRRQLTETAGEHATRIFARNLESLLMQPPVRGRSILGIDPGYRTGCKLAVLDDTGRLLAVDVMYPHPPQNQVDVALTKLRQLITTHDVHLVAIGNGTASRETEALVAKAINDMPQVAYVIVSEAGASVYSASDTARTELPQLDVSARGTVSIARRVLDPLAELVKIDPKSIGVGQYQHDVDQKGLASALTAVVESCVNRVGVHVNTASPALLQYVAGISANVSRQIVAYREENGPFRRRKDLLKVKGLGPKTYEQAAGFLRIPDGDEPLDGTAVHPESYAVANGVLQAAGLTELAVRADQEARATLRALHAPTLANQLGAGIPTVSDIIQALLRPGLDPRAELPPPPFRRDVLHMEDLRPGMLLTGTVQNVVDFGAFVDIGMEKAGLIHISRLSQSYVKHPLDVVTVGEPVKVEVISIDLDRGRIGLALVPR